MKLEDIKFGVSPLTNRVYIGTVSKKDPSLWVEKRDVVSDMCRVIIEWVSTDGVLEITGKNGSRFEVTVKQVDAGWI